MLLPGCHIVRTCLFFTVLIAAVISYPYPEDDKKTFNLKIGFDLTQGDNGAPKLLVRDFEDSKQIQRRAASDSDAQKYEEDADNKGKVFIKPKLARAVSSKSSQESEEEVSKPKEKARSSDEGSKEAEGGDKGPAPPPPPPLRQKSNEEDDAESDMDNKHSTKGLGAEDFDPEDTSPRVHSKDNDDDDRRRRRKRAAKIFVKYYNESKLKRKHKKVKHASFKPQRTTRFIF